MPDFNNKTWVDETMQNAYQNFDSIQQGMTSAFGGSYEAAFESFHSAAQQEGWVNSLYYNEYLKFIQQVFGINDTFVFNPHFCWWEPGYSRTSHFLRCPGCEARKKQDSHNHDGENGNCTCGYTYKDNSTLTVLALKDMELAPAFDPAVTEYTAKAVSWKQDVTTTRITAFPFDALATIDYSDGREVKPGAKFQITVTAEDGKTSTTYTVTVSE